MKTNNNAIQPSMAITLDDVIFSNRNQAYGAYYLRKTYNKHLFYALCFVALLLVLSGSAILIKNSLKTDVVAIGDPVLTIPITIDDPDFKIPEPPPQMNTSPGNNQPASENAPFVVVDSEETNSHTIPTNDALLNSNHNDSNIIVYYDRKPENDELGIDNSDPQIVVDEPATFNNGDLDEFRNWVQKNINYPNEAINADISGKVNLTFVVNKKGEVCDVKILRGVHQSIDNEAIRIILSSPKWKPAKRNGNLVKQLYSIPVNFRIN